MGQDVEGMVEYGREKTGWMAETDDWDLVGGESLDYVVYAYV